MAFPLLGAIGAIGGLLGGIGGMKAGKSAAKASNKAGAIADQQASLFQGAAPQYQDLLTALRGHAGLGGFTPGFVPSGFAMGGGNQPGSPYSQNIGIYGQPENMLRLRGVEEDINRNTRRNMDQLSFGLGRRGLAGSSIDATARAALLADAGRNRDSFARQLAINAPMEQERRLGLLASLLNPALQQGPAAANVFGNQQAQFGQQAGQAGAALGGSIQNFMQYDMMRRLLQNQGGGGMSTGQLQQMLPFGIY
jgi:hypothetical protein